MSGSELSPHTGPSPFPRVLSPTPGAPPSDSVSHSSSGDHVVSFTEQAVGCLSVNKSRYADVRSFSARRLSSVGEDEVFESQPSSPNCPVGATERSAPAASVNTLTSDSTVPSSSGYCGSPDDSTLPSSSTFPSSPSDCNSPGERHGRNSLSYDVSQLANNGQRLVNGVLSPYATTCFEGTVRESGYAIPKASFHHSSDSDTSHVPRNIDGHCKDLGTHRVVNTSTTNFDVFTAENKGIYHIVNAANLSTNRNISSEAKVISLTHKPSLDTTTNRATHFGYNVPPDQWPSVDTNNVSATQTRWKLASGEFGSPKPKPDADPSGSNAKDCGSSGARQGGTLSRELDLELVRLEILVDSLQEMEEQLILNEAEDGDNLSEYHSSEDGDLSSAKEMKQGMERSRAPRTAIPQYLRPSHQHQQHRTEHTRTPGVGSEDRAALGQQNNRQERAVVTPYATGLCPPQSALSTPPSPHPADLPPRPPHHPPLENHVPPVTLKQQYVTIQEHDRIHHQQQQQQYHHQQQQRQGAYSGQSNGVPEYSADVQQQQYRHATSASSTNPAASSTPASTATSTPPGLTPQDYPIRGTMSPLTSQVGSSQRGGGGGGGDGDGRELSFVFGRPATPDAAVVGRCASPPLSGSKRPLSPSSRNCLPIRRTASASSGVVVEREVLSPPATPSLSSWGEGRILQGGVCCEHCNGCLIELKRQALRLMFPDNGNGACLAQSVRIEGLEERLAVPEALRSRYATGRCHVCETQVAHLKGEAIAMIRSIQLAQNAATSITNTSIPALVGSCTIAPQQHRYGRQGKSGYPAGHPSLPLAAQAQAYLEHNVRAWMNPKKYNQMLAARAAGHSDRLHTGDSVMATTPDLGPRTHPHPSTPHLHPHTQGRPPLPGGAYHPSLPTSPPPSHHVPSRGVSPGPSSVSSAGSPPPNSAAVSFFHRAAQKLSKKKKRQHSQEPEPPSYPTSYSQVVRLTPPPAPPCLLRAVGRMQNPGVGKVKVMLKICAAAQGTETGARFLSVDPHRKQITIFDPSASGYVTSANRRTGIAAPKMFAFDAVFSPDDSLTELCAASLSEIVQAVVSGADGCLFTYGYSRTGKTHTMLGTDQSGLTLGVMPCAIAWLFKLINEQKDKTGARFSVRVSAVEVTGKNEVLRDLLADMALGTEATGVGTAPGVYLREDPICGTQLENQSELRAPTADKAALYLDAALAARSAADEDEARCSHLLFTLNVYQYRIEKANRAGLPGVAGGRSRLHLIDLGNASKSRDPGNVSLSLSALGNVIMALLNGQRHVPHRDSKISQLLRDSLGNVTCRTCMLAHVSSAVPHYNETLQVIQLAARIHRMKRRRTKFSSTSSEDSSTDESAKFRRPYRGLRMGTLREDVLYSSSHSDPDYTSSSEQSCDTVIYLGANGQSLSDRELTDNEGPPRHVPRTNPRLPRRPSGSRSSGDDSDSGRSRASEGRYAIPPHRGLAVRAGTPVQGGSPTAVARVQPVPHVMSAPGSPSPAHVKMAHRMNLQAKGAVPKTSTAAESHDKQKQHAHRVKEHPPIQGEQWVDGPGAAIYTEAKKTTEQWVDGPSAFVVQSEQPQPQTPVAPQSPSHRGDTARRMKNRKVDAEEQWVDGPREMMTTASGSAPGGSTPLHTSSKTAGLEPGGTAGKSGQVQANKLSVAVSEKALKQALIKHLERERPESTISVDSNVSTMAEAADSRPASMVSSGEGSKLVEDPHSGSKSAWADKRLAGDGVSMVDPHDLETLDVNTDMHVEPTSPSHHRKHHKDHLGKKLHASLASPKHSPKASPSCGRKGSVESSKVSRLQKSDLPGSASPTHRVAAWIKSVSSTDASPSTASDGLHTIAECPPAEVASEHKTVGVTAARTGQHVGQFAQPSHREPITESDVMMADAETNTEHDSDFERMADLEDSPPPRCGDDVTDLCNMADASFDSSVDTGADRSGDSRRDSLYELTVEEQLEGLASRKDSSLLARDVDDETFSSLSCSAREADDTDKEESVLVTNTKVLTEGRQSAKLARHLASQGSHEPSPPRSGDCDLGLLPDLSKPLLSRKPDGASNPHLNREFCEEDALSKDHLRLASETCVSAHYATVCHSDASDVYAAPQGLYGKDVLGDLPDSPSLSAKGSKLAIRSKPPLPQKPSASSSASSSPKASVLPKASVSSSCSSSGPSAGSSATSTPKSVSSKDSPLLHKQTSPKGSALPVFSTPHAGRKDKDKCGKTSKDKSSTSSSSLTSSPATVSKNGQQKANGKNQTSKLPLFSNTRGSPVTTTKESKLRKKEKENSGKNGRSVNGKYVEVSSVHHHHKPRAGNNDSDSGNDSGIVAHEKKLLSPYATVTKPRTPSHSSSGHGSDNSSTISTEVHSQPSSKGDKLHGGTSSGYESMLRESEGTASSDEHEESGSENSDRKKGSKRKGTKRSRSAPARSSESPGSNGGQSNGGRTWIEARHGHKSAKEEPLELKKYDMEDVDRMQRRRQDEGECRNGERNGIRGKDSQGKQSVSDDSSKPEIIDAKDRISIERSGWAFDCKFLMCFCKSRNSRGTDV